MLILSRRLGEKIVVPGCDLTVEVIGIQGNRVRLGITAPPDLAVYREELLAALGTDGIEDQKSDQELRDALAADLSDAAYQIAIRHRLGDPWINLATDVWRSLAAIIKKSPPRLLPAGPAPDLRVERAKPAPLPR